MRAIRRARAASSDRELRLWKVGRALTVTFAAAVLAAGSIFYTLIVLLDFQEIDTAAKLDAKTLFDIVKLSFGVVAGAGALVALVVAYRRQRVDEAGAHREATRLHTERFSQAVDKLGSDSPAVRLGGVHALAGLADDAPDSDLRQTCIDVLCAYLRLPFPTDPGYLPDTLPDGSTATQEERDAHQNKKDMFHALREVRHTVLRLLGDHYRIPEGTHRSWQGCDLDLTGVTFDGRMDFGGATFPSGTVSFDGALFSSGTVSFDGALFSGGTVSFVGASFTGGEVSFSVARFFGGNVSFRDARFSGGRVSFRLAMFSGGEVTFDDALLAGGEVRFDDAQFTGGGVWFEDVRFSGGRASFDRAAFSGGEVTFNDALFADGTVSFDGTNFSAGTVYFGGDGFEGARFSAGSVSFADARGPVPQGLLSAVGNSDPSRIVLPSSWLH